MVGVGGSLIEVADLDAKIGSTGYNIFFGLKNISKSCRNIRVSKVTDADGWLTIIASSMYGSKFVSLVKAEWLFNSKLTEVIEVFLIFRVQSYNCMHESQLQVSCDKFFPTLDGSILLATSFEKKCIVDRPHLLNMTII